MRDEEEEAREVGAERRVVDADLRDAVEEGREDDARRVVVLAERREAVEVGREDEGVALRVAEITFLTAFALGFLIAVEGFLVAERLVVMVVFFAAFGFLVADVVMVFFAALVALDAGVFLDVDVFRD